MKRIIGLVLIVVAAVSLVVSAAGVYEIWALRQPVADATAAGVNLFAETLNTTSDALQVASASLQSASDTITTVEQTSVSVAQTMSTTRATLGSFSVLMGKDLPASIDSTRTAVKSAQSSAVVVDNVLTSLSRIPFINLQYNPAEFEYDRQRSGSNYHKLECAAQDDATRTAKHCRGAKTNRAVSESSGRIAEANSADRFRITCGDHRHVSRNDFSGFLVGRIAGAGLA